MPVAVLPPLAVADDVAESLGVSDVTKLPSTMQIRMDTTLAKVSRRFRKEAQRIFTPGVYTHRLMIHGGTTRLMEAPNKIVKVKIDGLCQLDYDSSQVGGEQWSAWAEGDDADLDYPPYPQSIMPSSGHLWWTEGPWMRWKDWDYWRLEGREVDITYGWDTPVPPEVVTSVADIVGRNLSIDPLSPLRQSKLLMSRHHRQELADWVISGGTGFSKLDIEEAQSYRYPVPPVIIARMTMLEMSPSSAFLADSSW